MTTLFLGDEALNIIPLASLSVLEMCSDSGFAGGRREFNGTDSNLPA